MSSNKPNTPSDEFLKMFDALLLIETSADAKELVRNADLIENLEFHETETTEDSEEQESP
jgi:hypothetical protein